MLRQRSVQLFIQLACLATCLGVSIGFLFTDRPWSAIPAIVSGYFISFVVGLVIGGRTDR